MSRITKQAALSRRTRRPEPPAQAAFAEDPKFVSNPIFYCEDGPNPLKPGDLRCSYGSGTIHGLVHDPDPAAAGKPLPLPLPPSRTHLPASHAGPTLVMSTNGRLLRRGPQDPFLAAYVACRKNSGGKDPAQAKQQKKNKRGELRGCAIWNTGVMSCKYGCAVKEDSAAVVQAPASPSASAPTCTLDLSRPPAVLPARERALEWRRPQS